MFSWDSVLPAITALLGVGVTLIFQWLRARADNQNAIARDNAQRVFEYKRALLDSNREAGKSLLQSMSAMSKLTSRIVTMNQRAQDDRQTLVSMHEHMTTLTTELQEKIDSMDGNPEMAQQVSEIREQSKPIISLYQGQIASIKSRLATLDQDVANILALVDATRDQMMAAVHALQLDAQEVDLIAPLVAFMSTSIEHPQSKEEGEASKACVVALQSFLASKERELLQLAPPKKTAFPALSENRHG